jgi:ubiquinone/menaquinone biosynthesis C-methylase UbiE
VNEKNNISKDIINILEKLRKNKKIKMVDVGSGDGNLAINFINNKKVDLTVTDISETRLERIKQITKNKLSNYVQDDINNSKLKSNYFDFVNSEMVIEHVPSDKKMLKEVNRILNKNGYFRISTVFKKGFSFWFYRNNGKWVIDPTHVREYSSQKEVNYHTLKGVASDDARLVRA